MLLSTNLTEDTKRVILEGLGLLEEKLREELQIQMDQGVYTSEGAWEDLYTIRNLQERLR
jgi:hypothetical protein